MAVVQREPHLQDKVEDLRQTGWNELIAYGEQYLGFTEGDARIIRAANRQRQDVAHGKNYLGSRDELVEYGAFVERWCNSSQAPPREGNSQPKQEVDVSYASLPPAMPPKPYSRTPQQPWYRSTAFLILTFFLLPPVWAWLIITDRSQARAVTTSAYAVLVLVFLCGIGVVSSSIFLADPLTEIFAQLNIPLVSSTIPKTTATSAITGVPSEAIMVTSVPPTVLAATDAVCTIVWLEHPQDNLARKSRSWVWEEIVKFRVEGSGMTPREFYDLVVEHNPELEADDYEFKEGKMYFLPECQ
jgi:hypothetical protein